MPELSETAFKATKGGCLVSLRVQPGASRNAVVGMYGDAVKIALIHFPPFDSRMGSTPFTDLFTAYGVKKVVYGHLHGQKCRAEMRSVKNGTEYFLTSCDIIGNKLVPIDER